MEHPALETLTTCPLCGGHSRGHSTAIIDRSLTQETFLLEDCPKCGLRYTNPRPGAHELGRYYEGERYISHTNARETLLDRLYQLARKRALRSKQALIFRHQSNGRVLDVGCGTGQFLGYLMSRGYLVQGVEPSLKAREHAIANYGFPVVPTLDHIQTRESFQVITMWHVLEHIADLRGSLKKLYALLGKNGTLLIAVPDRESWDAEYYGRDWAGWDVPRHLTHFRRRDIAKLLDEHGFQLIETRRMLLDPYYICILSEQYRGVPMPWALLKGILLGAWSNLISLSTGRPSSSSLFVARKLDA